MRLKRRGRGFTITACMACAVCGTASQASGAVDRLLTVAGRSVVAVEGGAEPTTGFGFTHGSAVLGASQLRSLRIITANGAIISVTPFRHVGDISAARLITTGVAPLPAARRRATDGEVGYLLGPPLGYREDKIRRVVLRVVPTGHGNLLRVTGTLPRPFRGAPLVTSSGHLLGAVDAIASKSWILLPVSGVNALIAAPAARSRGSSVIRTVGLASGVLVVMVVAFGTIVMLRRRRTVHHRRADAPDDAQSPERAAAPTSLELPTQPMAPAPPLVRSRAPSQSDDPSDDFDIVVKSRDAEP